MSSLTIRNSANKILFIVVWCNIFFLDNSAWIYCKWECLVRFQLISYCCCTRERHSADRDRDWNSLFVNQKSRTWFQVNVSGFNRWNLRMHWGRSSDKHRFAHSFGLRPAFPSFLLPLQQTMLYFFFLELCRIVDDSLFHLDHRHHSFF